MKLDYLENINEYGDCIVRLYNFDKSQAIKFRKLIQQIILTEKKELNLGNIDFIQARNCSLTLRLSPTDEGIVTSDNKTFFCDLTTEGYVKIVSLLDTFCEKETKGYQYLYDVDSLIDLLFSPVGTY